MENKNKNVLITGAAGFIGSNVLRYLALKYKEYDFINYDALTYAGNLDNLNDIVLLANYRFVHGDIRDPEKLDKLFKDFEITDVIHFAAESHVDRSMVNPTVFVETNVIGTVNLLNAARKAWKDDNKQHICLNMATDEMFGALSNDDKPFDENTPFDPHSPYSTSKTAAAMFGKTYFEAYGLPVINLACGNAIGPKQFPEKLVPLTIDRIVNREKIPIYGEGKQKRDWTNVNDIATAVDLLIHSGTPGELYCIGGDACTENIQIVKEICYAYAWQTCEGDEAEKNTLAESLFEELVEFIPDPRGKSHDFRYDINHNKITKELGWTPKYTFKQSVSETVKWYLENQEWVTNVKTGEYVNWMKTYYKE